MDLINKACDVLSIIDKRKKKYETVNKLLRDLQGDFHVSLDAIEEQVEISVVGLLDGILGAELASYWLYECLDRKDGGLIEDNGKEWRIKTIQDVKKYARHLAKIKRDSSHTDIHAHYA